MTKRIWLPAMALLWLGAVIPASWDDKLTSYWEERVHGMERFEFAKDEASVWDSLRKYKSEYDVDVVFTPPMRVVLRFLLGDEEKLVLVGHIQSVFRTDGNLLYFAHFSYMAEGCTVAAYNLATGEKIWETELKAVPGAGSFGLYGNRVNMKLERGAVCVAGQESCGDYVEVLRRTTGERLAYRVFSEGYGGNRRTIPPKE